MTKELRRELRVGPGVARMFHTGPTESTYEYEESGKLLSALWDPRETNFVLVVSTGLWEKPAGLEMNEQELERVRDAFWEIASQTGPQVMVEELIGFTRWFILRWEPMPHGFLANIFDDRVDYMEPGLTLTLPRHGRYPDAVLELPEEPRWTYPEGEPIDPAKWQSILARLQAVADEDVWIGLHGMRVRIPEAAFSDGPNGTGQP